MLNWVLAAAATLTLGWWRSPRWRSPPAVRRRAQGLLPGAGHRRDPGHHRAPQSISFAAMAERQQALAAPMLQDPAVASLSSFIGVDGTNPTLNSGAC